MLCACLAAPLTAVAQEKHLYLGGGIGGGEVTVTGFAATIGALPVNATQGVTRDTAFKIYGGYQINPNWGLEIGYDNLGNRYSITGTAGGVPGSAAYSVENVYGAVVGTLPLGETPFSLLGKIGVVRNSAGAASVCGGGACAGFQGARSRTQPLFGAGAQYRLPKGFSLRLEAEHYGKATSDDVWGTQAASGAVNASAWYLSLRYDW